MKSIKFRACDRKERRMERVISLAWDDNRDYPTFVETESCSYSLVGLQDIILMRYIGRKDKNNKEIYEEDIVKGYLKNGDEIIGIVRYNPKEATYYIEVIKIKFFGEDEYSIFCIPVYLYHIYNIEVIGNIYENPELLEEGKHESNNRI